MFLFRVSVAIDIWKFLPPSRHARAFSRTLLAAGKTFSMRKLFFLNHLDAVRFHGCSVVQTGKKVQNCYAILLKVKPNSAILGKFCSELNLFTDHERSHFGVIHPQLQTPIHAISPEALSHHCSREGNKIFDPNGILRESATYFFTGCQLLSKYFKMTTTSSLRRTGTETG